MADSPIGKVIARARHRKRWTQRQLAEVLGVSVATVANWERGEHFPLRNIGAIEEALDISLDGYDPQPVTQ
jgi:transcriptional regulator with XRE-family HTH domain